MNSESGDGCTDKKYFPSSLGYSLVLKVMLIGFLEVLTRATDLVHSLFTLTTPKSTFWSSDLSSSSLKGVPSPLTKTSILCSPLMSNVTVWSYLMHSRGVKIMGMRRTLSSFVWMSPFLSLLYSVYKGKMTCPEARPISKKADFTKFVSILMAEVSRLRISR